MRLTILCEGITEYRVLETFLSPYCTDFEKVEVLKPSGEGGSGRLKTEFKQLAEIALFEPGSYVVCLIDLKNAPFKFPQHVEDAAKLNTARAAYIKDYFESRIDKDSRSRFFCFPVVAELETWLLADDEALQQFFRSNSINAWHEPESVTDPIGELKKLMLKHRQRSSYQKTTDGENLFKLASAEKVYQDNCPHFDALINKLLEIQGKPPQKAIPQENIFEIPCADLYEKLAKLQHQLDGLWEQAKVALETGITEAVHTFETQITGLEMEIAQAEQELQECISKQ